MSYSYEINEALYMKSFNEFKSSFLEKALKKKASKGQDEIYIFGNNSSVKKVLTKGLEKWQIESVLSTNTVENIIQTKNGNKRIIRFYNHVSEYEQTSQADKVGQSDYSVYRDLGGEYWKHHSSQMDAAKLCFFDCSTDQIEGFLVGIELAQYKFKRVVQNKVSSMSIEVLKDGKKLSFKDISYAAWLGAAVNLSRHLVNVPPSVLNPENYVKVVKKLFADSKNTKVTVWNRQKLKQEKMGLLLAVGQSSAKSPAMVNIQYAPAKKSQPIAFVGKGITYDTGGLDLKPSAAMRLMKKDMGGSATVVALAYLAVNTQSKQAADFYLAIAENLVSNESFKSSDVLHARNGLNIEVDNTDAEGRLALADVLDVAVTQNSGRKPKYVVDVATLTGAMKIGLGSEVAGYFSNNEELAAQIEASGFHRGDLVWRMPLIQQYRKKLTTPFGDMLNCGDRFGGAITAALFLESFVRNVPWAHLDIFSWQYGKGPFAEAGGSGQAVQTLSELL